MKTKLFITTALILFLIQGFSILKGQDLFRYLDQKSTVLNKDQSRYLEAIKNHPASIEIYLIQFYNISSFTNSKSISFQLPTLSVKASLSYFEQLNGLGFAWGGNFLDQQGSVLFSIYGTDVRSLIHSKVGIFSIKPLGQELHVLVHIDQSKFSPCGCKHPETYPGFKEENSDNLTDEKRSLSKTSMLANRGNPVIDILIVYTQAAKSSVSNINGLITDCISSTNYVCGRSDARATVNKVYSTQVSYTESGDLWTDVCWLKGNGYINNLREQYGADIVVLLVATGNYDGIVYEIRASSSKAFSVVKTDAAFDNLTFAHEIAHIIGGYHDTWPDPDPIYARGYYRKNPDWRTVLGVFDDNFQRIPHYSNPSKDWDGLPTGTAAENNVARVWRERRYTVAGFISSQLSVSISGPSIAPCETGTWTANVSNGTPPYTYQWYHMWVCDGNIKVPCDEWNSVGTNSSMLQMYLCSGNSILRVDVEDSEGITGSDQHYVYDSGGGLKKPALNNSVKEFAGPSDEFILFQNYPNPFNPETEITFFLSEQSNVFVTIKNVLGREVATIANGQFAKGYHQIHWLGQNEDGQAVVGGIYFCCFNITSESGQKFSRIKKMLLLK
ncbi:hypothetical protein H8E88_34750 [candidate division KSB1 bacterium]|nr:hypothetical protein [candidate division KSB1 bacterium]